MTPPSKRILVYSDVSAFGGHEVMSLAACDAIRNYFPKVSIEWLVSSDNERLLQRLSQGGYAYKFLRSAPRKRLLKHPLDTLIAVMANANKIRRLAPDVVLVAQGIITFGFLGCLAARLAGVPNCCYLPNGDLASACNQHGHADFLDSLWRFCFRHTPNFITIDEEQKRLISLSNPKARIRVVENYVPANENSSPSRNLSRKTWGIPADKKVIGVVARVEFVPKNQDWVVRQLSEDPFWDDFLVLFVGDGPDFEQLAEMVQEFGLEQQVRLLGWKESVHTLYPALDLLLIPSLSEGVPLVMLEALLQKVPVVGSDRDGMKTWLPQELRFDVGDGEGMKCAVLAAMRSQRDDFWNATNRHLEYIQDRKRFASEFLDAALSFL